MTTFRRVLCKNSPLSTWGLWNRISGGRGTFRQSKNPISKPAWEFWFGRFWFLGVIFKNCSARHAWELRLCLKVSLPGDQQKNTTYLGKVFTLQMGSYLTRFPKFKDLLVFSNKKPPAPGSFLYLYIFLHLLHVFLYMLFVLSGPKLGPCWLNWAQVSSKLAHFGSKLAPSWFQVGPR